tara:strand:+ start:1728 stop:2159 length:432 start_codon:yes stop_codon:yes gene_type:complete
MEDFIEELDSKEYVAKCTLRYESHMTSARKHIHAVNSVLRELCAHLEDEELIVDMDTIDDASLLIRNQVVTTLNEIDNMVADVTEVTYDDKVELLHKEIKTLKSTLLHTDDFIRSFKKWSAYEFSEYKLNDKLPNTHIERNIV